MHELSLITQVVETLNDFFKDHPVKKVYSVTLSVGTVSGIVPHYLTDAWQWFTKDEELYKGSKLKIDPIHAYTTCLDCGEVYDTIQYVKICPRCKSDHTVLKQGNEFIIKEVEAE